MTDKHCPPLGVVSSDRLGLAPERAGQPRMMTIIDGAQEDATGHWYSPAAVREMLAAERERCIATLRALKDRSGTNDNGTNWLVRRTRGDCVAALEALKPNVRAEPPR